MSSSRLATKGLATTMQSRPDPMHHQSLRSRIAHAGEANGASGQPLSDPIYQGSVYAFSDAGHAEAVYASGEPLYARDGLPNVRALERAVAELEGAEDAMATPSGMSAISTTFLSLLSSGDHVVIGDRGYCDTSSLLRDMGERFNVRVTRADLGDPEAVRQAITPATAFLYAETIANPSMRLADLPALATITHEHGALLVVDNTLASPALCHPLEFGADLVLHSAGKFLGGHSDVTAGIVAGPTRLIARLKRTAFLYGPVLAPMEAWLTLRGIKTLAPRMQWISASAGTIADWLGRHPAVASVHYAGRPDPDQRELADRMLPMGGGGVLTFQLKGGVDVAANVLTNLRSIPYVSSIGGPVTIASFPPRTPCFNEEGLPVNVAYRCDTIRLSVGLEAPADVIAQLKDALDAVHDARNAERQPEETRHA